MAVRRAALGIKDTDRQKIVDSILVQIRQFRCKDKSLGVICKAMAVQKPGVLVILLTLREWTVVVNCLDAYDTDEAERLGRDITSMLSGMEIA